MVRMNLSQMPSQIRDGLKKENMQGSKLGKKSKNKANKFNAVKVKDETGKVIADSKAERAFETGYLSLLLKSGLISQVTKWETVRLTTYVKWKVDFSYYDKERKQKIWVDVKGGRGTQDGRFLTLKQLWRSHGPGLLIIAVYDYKNGTWILTETKPDKFNKEEE